MASEKILDFDFSDIEGFDAISTTGLIQDSGYGTIPSYTYSFQVQFAIETGKNLINAPHIQIEYKRYNSDTHYFINSVDRYENGIYYCAYESSSFGTQPIEIINIVCSGLADIYVPFNSDYPMLRVQKVDLTAQSEIAQHRFYNDIQQEYRYDIDLGQFIDSIVRYPFEVETGQDADIVLGFAILNFQAPLLTKRIYKFTLFDDVIHGLFRDSRDEKTTDIFAMLPFFGKYTIDSKYINKNIKIVYEIDVMCNECVIKIYNNDILIDSVNTQVGFNIPYILKVSEKSFAIEKPSKSEILKNFDTPQIVVEQSENVLGNLYNVEYFGDLTNLTGFVQIEDFYLHGIKSKTEYDELKRIVENGFYI